MAGEANGQKFTKADRDELKGVVKRRAVFSKQQAKDRLAQIKAEGERQLAEQFAAEDERWADVTRRAAAVAGADAEIARICEAVGVPSKFRPRLVLSWVDRGENADPARRVELRRLMAAYHDANMQATLSEIERAMPKGS
jgi:hypothetical protein